MERRKPASAICLPTHVPCVPVPDRKQPPHSIPKLRGPGVRLLVRMLPQKPDVADPMYPAERSFDREIPGERAVGREVIEVQAALKFRADQLWNEDFLAEVLTGQQL
jgi:hypothetical protein